MALDVEMDDALRTADELGGLVIAITEATEHDETNWLELKSTLDLGVAESRFKLAKAILGFSNRSVEVAAQQLEGSAYLVVGADQDGVHGVAEVDVASLEQSLTPYLGTGDDAPRWSCRYLRVDGKSVLVVTVESPAAGHRARTLRKKFGSFEPGSIFVRGQAKTELATPDDVRMLEDRLTRGLGVADMNLQVVSSVSHGGLLYLADYTDTDEARQWGDSRRVALLAKIPKPTQSQNLDSVAAILAASGSAASSKMRDEYTAEVDAYVRTCQARLQRAIVRSVVTSERNKVTIRVVNPSTLTASAVRLAVAVPRSVAAVYDVAPEDSKLPEPPSWSEMIGATLRIPSFAQPQFDVESMKFGPRGRAGEVSVQVEGDITHVVWKFGDLHAGQSEVGDEVTFAPASDGPIELAWTATASNRKGQSTGQVQIPVIEDSRWAFG